MGQKTNSGRGQSREGERTSAIRAIKGLLFSASIVPALVAGAVAAHYGRFEAGLFLVLASALFLAQCGGDYLYYYFTRLRPLGPDGHGKIFAGWRPLFAETLLRGKGVLAAGGACLGVDLLLGLYFTARDGWPVALFGGLGGLVALFFTPLMLRGLKEVVIFFTFGPLSVLGVTLVMTGEVPVEAWAASVPVGSLVALVAHLKSAHFKLVAGEEGQVVVTLRRGLLVALTVGAFASLVVLVLFGALPALSLLGLAGVPLSIAVLRVATRASSRLVDYLWAVVRSILVLVVTGLLIAAGLVFTGEGGL